jgi:hypothetical protein
MAIFQRSLSSLVLISVLIFFIALLGGCAGGPPSPEELASADYGIPISQVNAQRAALEFIKRYLKAPESARIDWSPIAPGWVREASVEGGGLRFGYKLPAQINEKNSYGAYMGYKPYVFMFFNGTLSSVYTELEYDGFGYKKKSYLGRIY